MKPSSESTPGRPLLFLHIRKTAGSSIRHLLLPRFAAGASLVLTGRVEDPGGHLFVTGHVGYDYVARFATRPIVLTILRDPLERAISAYYYYRTGDDPTLREFGSRARGQSLLELLEREGGAARPVLSNVQTRCLLTAGGSSAEGRSEAELIAEATRNLASCEIVGLTERLPESVAMIAHRMGWEGLGPIPHDNPTRVRCALDDVDRRAREILVEWNRLDAELYRFAARLFEARLQQMAIAAARTAGRGSTIGLPSCDKFTFDQSLHGGGWHQRERDHGGWFCWSSREAWIDLRGEHSGEHVLRCRVAHVLRRSILDGLAIRVNGCAVSPTIRDDRSGDVVEARVPAGAVQTAERVRIAFSLKETLRPVDLDASNDDRRDLGIALRGIQLIPAGRARAWWRPWPG